MCVGGIQDFSGLENCGLGIFCGLGLSLQGGSSVSFFVVTPPGLFGCCE